MTLVTRSAVRLSRRGNQAIKSARANAAFFTTAANQATNLLPKARAESSRMKMPSASGEYCSTLLAIHKEDRAELDVQYGPREQDGKGIG